MLVRILPFTGNKQNLRVNFIEKKDRNFSKSHVIYLDLLPRGICYCQHVINDVHPKSKINIISFLKAIYSLKIYMFLESFSCQFSFYNSLRQS